MARYVDGFVIPIKKSNIKHYKKLAALGRKIWMEHGAIDYYECIGDDWPKGIGLPFPKLCKLKAGETIAFAFIIFKSKAERNRINAKVMKDPRMDMSAEQMKKMPFDMKRFSMGGFKVLIGP